MSLLWGSPNVSLQCANKQGHFEIQVRHHHHSGSFVMLSMLVPNYLTDVEPVVVLDDEDHPDIRLIFLCHDRPPEVMVVSETWESLCKQLQLVAELDRQELRARCGFDSDTDVNLDIYDFEQMLTIQSQHSDMFC